MAPTFVDARQFRVRSHFARTWRGEDAQWEWCLSLQCLLTEGHPPFVMEPKCGLAAYSDDAIPLTSAVDLPVPKCVNEAPSSFTWTAARICDSIIHFQILVDYIAGWARIPTSYFWKRNVFVSLLRLCQEPSVVSGGHPQCSPESYPLCSSTVPSVCEFAVHSEVSLAAGT